MLYCLKYRKNIESKNLKVVKNKIRRIILSWKYSVCDSKKMKFLKERETRGLLSNFTGVKIRI